MHQWQCGHPASTKMLAVCEHVDSVEPRHAWEASSTQDLCAPRCHGHSRWILHTRCYTLEVCSLFWMLVIIFGHLAKDGVTMETTKQWSSQQACRIVKGEPLRGGQGPPSMEQAPLSFLRAGLHFLAAVSALALWARSFPSVRPADLLSLPRVAFVSLHLFRSLARLCWLFGSWPNSSWGLYRNC